MIPISAFHQYVLPVAPEVPDPVVDQYVRLAAIEFCQRTRCWRHIFTMDISGDHEETVLPMGQSNLYEIEHAWFRLNNTNAFHPLERVPYYDVNPSAEHGVNRDGIPQIITQSHQDKVMVLPRSTGVLRLSAFLTPTNDAEYVPRHVFESHMQDIADGALSRILLLPGHGQQDPQMAALKAGQFNAACDHYFNLNHRGQQRAPARARSSFV